MVKKQTLNGILTAGIAAMGINHNSAQASTSGQNCQEFLTRLNTNTQKIANKDTGNSFSEKGDIGANYTSDLQEALLNAQKASHPCVESFEFVVADHVRAKGADGFFLVRTDGPTYIVNNPRDFASTDLPAKLAIPTKGDPVFDFNEGQLLGYDLSTGEFTGENLSSEIIPRGYKLLTIYNSTGEQLIVCQPKWQGNDVGWTWQQEKELCLTVNPGSREQFNPYGPTVDKTGKPMGGIRFGKSRPAGMVYQACAVGGVTSPEGCYVFSSDGEPKLFREPTIDVRPEHLTPAAAKTTPDSHYRPQN